MPPGRPKGSEFIKFAVQGNGAFPIDMLRYDSCWPLRGDDSSAIYRSITFPSRDKQIIWLKTSGKYDMRPNVQRWASFGWEVINTERCAA